MQHIEFIDWASQYDDGDLNTRSRKLHEMWINELSCKVFEFIDAESNHGAGIPMR